ncbi:bZIP transcription factor 44-like [Euphorbia lathyris]|uniref:bZIP transcription factor 44-like n=1 Tax=Euphorbia lathyris TaxID=212925 RepID=UPI003313F5E3
MGSLSGTSSGSSLMISNSGSEGDLQVLMDQRKRKRMISNRESARRSRMRKQKHLDDLTAQISQLRKENQQLITSINITTQHFLNIDSDNSILRAQVGELTHRLQSLNEIINFLTANNTLLEDELNDGVFVAEPVADSFMNPLMNMGYHLNNHPIMASASADFFQY